MTPPLSAAIEHELRCPAHAEPEPCACPLASFVRTGRTRARQFLPGRYPVAEVWR